MKMKMRMKMMKILRLFTKEREQTTSLGGARRLDAGDAFPRMSWRTVDDERLTVPDDFAGRWAVILVYRGHW